MEESVQITSHQKDEISLREFIIKLQEWGRYLWSKWLIILIVGIIGGVCGIVYSLLKKPSYLAELTFVLEESNSNSLGAYIGLASQFGIDLGMGSGSGIYSGDNILEFLKSRLMVEKTLLSPATSNNESLADYYVKIYELNKKWNKKEELNGIHFSPTQERSKFSLVQDSLLGVLYTRVIEMHLNVMKPDKKLGFIAVRCYSQDELFSKLFVERLVKEATDFYIITKTQRFKTTVEKLQGKADSVEMLLNKKTYSAAVSQDVNLNPVRKVASVDIELAMRDKVMLQTMYAEIVKNLELSKIAMAQETPIIQIVDTPILPLEDKKIGILLGAILGGFIGGFLITAGLIVKRCYKQIMMTPDIANS